MLSRRSFLFQATAIALWSLLTGCNRSPALLKIVLLANSIPPQSLGRFRSLAAAAQELAFQPEERLSQLFELLQAWKQLEAQKPRGLLPSGILGGNGRSAIADLMTLGHYWLPAAVEQQLIEPLNPARLTLWPKLPPLWQRFVRRNESGQLDPAGEIWGAPYRWGTTAIAYDRRKFAALGWTPTDWSDLWRPELRDRIATIDQPREVIGLTLKKLGYSYNTSDLSKIPNLKSELIALHQQVKFYSSSAYLQPLILEDVWVAVGWSADIWRLQESYPQIESVIPVSGTALWSDLWVVPKPHPGNAPNSPILQRQQQAERDQWMDFCWQKDAAFEISLWSDGLSPMLLSLNPAELPKSLQSNPAIAQSRIIATKSELLEPLSPEANEQYQSLWQTVRQMPHFL